MRSTTYHSSTRSSKKGMDAIKLAVVMEMATRFMEFSRTTRPVISAVLRMERARARPMKLEKKKVYSTPMTG